VDPLCMKSCPVGSITRLGSSLDIRIEDWCIGCAVCANDCPYGSIDMRPYNEKEQNACDKKNEDLMKIFDLPQDKTAMPKAPFKAEVCDLCADQGHKPNCVYACPHDAAFRVSPRKFFNLQGD